MGITKMLIDGHPMSLVNNSESKVKIGNDSPHSHYAASHADIRHVLSAAHDIFTMVGQVDSVIELFGGSGWESSLIQRINKPKIHEAWDISQDCVDSIAMSLPNVTAKVMDSYTAEVPSADFVVCDFNQLTWSRYKREAKYKGCVDRAAAAAKKWLTLTDSGMYGISRFAQNRAAYGIKSKGDVAEYYLLWRDKLAADGLTLRGVWTWHSSAAIMLFERDSKAPKWKPVLNRTKATVTIERAPD